MDVENEFIDDTNTRSLRTLYIFKNEGSEDLYKSVHFYSQNGSCSSLIQDFLLTFSSCSPQKDSCKSSTQFSSANEGEMYLLVLRHIIESEGWRLIFSFGKENITPLSHSIPTILNIEMNPSLSSIPILAHDLSLAYLTLTQPELSNGGDMIYPSCFLTTNTNLFNPAIESMNPSFQNLPLQVECDLSPDSLANKLSCGMEYNNGVGLVSSNPSIFSGTTSCYLNSTSDALQMQSNGDGVGCKDSSTTILPNPIPHTGQFFSPLRMDDVNGDESSTIHPPSLPTCTSNTPSASLQLNLVDLNVWMEALAMEAMDKLNPHLLSSLINLSKDSLALNDNDAKQNGFNLSEEIAAYSLLHPPALMQQDDDLNLKSMESSLTLNSCISLFPCDSSSQLGNGGQSLPILPEPPCRIENGLLESIPASFLSSQTSASRLLPARTCPNLPNVKNEITTSSIHSAIASTQNERRPLPVSSDELSTLFPLSYSLGMASPSSEPMNNLEFMSPIRMNSKMEDAKPSFPSESSNLEKQEDEMDSNDLSLIAISRIRCLPKSPSDKLNEITFEELSEYFDMPITKAAKKLGVGLTVLKKRCREFNIPRWPHRKMKSIDYLINNLHVLTMLSGERPNINRTLKELQQQKRNMVRNPKADLSDKTKKLRQSCFKANYKYRRQLSNQIEMGQTVPP